MRRGRKKKHLIGCKNHDLWGFFFFFLKNERIFGLIQEWDVWTQNTTTHTHTSTCDAEYIVFDSDHREEETCEEFYFQNAIQYINSVQYYDFYRQDFTYHNYYKYYYYYYYYKCYSLELQRLIDQSIGKKKNHLATIWLSSCRNATQFLFLASQIWQCAVTLCHIWQ